MDYTDAQRVDGIFFKERNPDSQPEDVEMVSVEESGESVNTKYDMVRNKKNLALIINNVKFDKSTGMPERQGSDKDASAIKHTLESLHFQVINRTNLSVKSMEQIFWDISTRDYANYNCFVCVILTHGEDNNWIYGTDDKVKLDDLVEMLLPNRCPGLIGKPKLFFVQACRGTKFDSGAVMHDAGDMRKKYENITSYKVPLWADVLLAYSTVPGFYSWRNSTNGSWFIQSLAHIFGKHGDRLELQQLMLSVNRRVAYEYESKTSHSEINEMKQVPCIASMLTKELYFYK
ncbi:caspase-3-like [Octopus bimaculoides]|uniref:Caspase family p20 domain-containing protein n=1 Tax=Octopus bimaculoides TaxID=37653 RepID=A0A0L8HBF0_OCTBM|nr:caspase-3-like [Octopus bimaculoides]